MDNDFINDFIEEYKNQPCLWQASSSDFKDRKKRQEAYYKLIEVANKHGEHYNIERTKQKINNLRCAFRHQLKKINESKNNKNGKDDGYCPKRRYIESLMFLLNEEQQECAKVDNLKTIPVTKRKSNNSNNNNNNNNNNNVSSTNCNNELPSKTKKTGVIKNDKQSQIYCEIVFPNESSSTINTTIISNDECLKKDKIIKHHHHQRQHHQQQHQQQQHHQQQQQQQQQVQQLQQSQQSDIIIKPIDDIPIETTTKIKETTIQQHNSPVQIEVHCDDDVNLLWQRSNITQQKCNESKTISNPVTISTIPVTKTVSIIPSTIPTSSISSITTTTTNANTKILETINTHNHNNPIRQRTMSTSSQNSSHSIVENATKKIKIDCSTINFDKILSLACSKINTIYDVDDDYSVFGKMVSYKLRSMESQQAIIAEKMITDILLEGQMKMLTYPIIRNLTTTTIPTTPTTTATAITIPQTFRRDNEAQALVINLNGNTATTTSADHHHHHSFHHQQNQDTTKYSS